MNTQTSGAINNTSGGAISITTGTLNMAFTSVSSSGGTNNVLLSGVGTSGTLDLGSGTLSGATSDAFKVSGGSGSFSYSGTISNTSTLAANIENKTGGTVTLSGDINPNTAAKGISVSGNNTGTNAITFSGANKKFNTGTGTGVNLSNNTGATISFTNGGLDIDTTSGTGFSATGGGTIIVGTGANPNTIDSTTGTALNVANTTIGSNGLTFKSISSNGGSNNGIILDTTGSNGGLTVTGDGTNTSVGGNSSGGTIANKSGADGSATQGTGVYLNNTSNVILRRMTINGTNQNYGIRGNSVNGFTLEYSTVSGANSTSQALDEGSANFDNLTGAAAITSSIIEGGLEDNLNVVNTSGTLNRLTISSSTFGFSNTANGNNNILIESQNSGTVLNFTLKSSLIKGARADWLNASNNSGSTMDAVIGGRRGCYELNEKRLRNAGNGDREGTNPTVESAFLCDFRPSS
jgi:hypothetical protein